MIGPDIAVATEDFLAVPNHSYQFIEAPQQGMNTRAFLVTNAGSAAMADIAVSKLGPDDTHFRFSETLPASIDPNETTPLLAEFSPTALGATQGGIRLTSNDADENPYDIIFQGTSLAPLNYWRKLHFSSTHNLGDAADGADPDFDGVVNLMEYAFGMNPRSPARGGSGSAAGWLPSASVETPDAPPRLRLAFLRRKASSLPGISYEVEFGSALHGGVSDEWLPATAAESVSPVDASWERVTVEDVQGDGHSKRFGRLRISND